MNDVTKTGWLRCKTCGSVCREDALGYRVCDGDPVTGNRDCRMEPCAPPADSPEARESRTAAAIIEANETIRSYEQHAKDCGEKDVQNWARLYRDYRLAVAIVELSSERFVTARTHPNSLWMVYYEDASVAPEIFFGEGAEQAARARYAQAKVSWSCHLLSRWPDSTASLDNRSAST